MELSPQQDVYYIDIVSPIDYFIDTVTPSAIQLNKEKTMSIELDGPLYLGSNSLQQQVDQNTEDITELQSDVSSIEGDIGSLDNLATSDKSSLVNAINETLSVLDPTQTADYIKNSKGLESGEISDNASIYPWVEEMSHSTFDRSKFTITGSPTITDEGIASGFSNDNYILTNTINGQSNYSIICKFNTGTRTQYSSLFSTNYTHGLIIDCSTSTNKLGFNIGNGTNWVSGDKTGITTISDNTDYTMKFEHRATGYYLYLLINNNWSLESYYETTTVFLNNNFGFKLGAFSNNNNAFTGSIDLKQFSITVDGVEVFSGNKTGLDVIKLDDFTTVGSPSITFDGIASGFSSSDYIDTVDVINRNKPWTQIIPVKFTDNTVSYQIFWRELNGQPSTFSRSELNIPDMKIATFLRSGENGTTNIGTIAGNNNSIQLNTQYYFKIEFTGSEYKTSLSTDGENYIQYGSTISSTTTLDNYAVRIGSGTYQWYLKGQIDLNAFKVYVDGDLVYQPCLKIPFTLSKTGAKIVDSIYRDRVTDMYEQYGYAPYYTLDTTNSNYTIPKGEVYGMVNKLVPTLVAPDYSKPVSLTYSSGLAMENDGWLEVQIQSSEATANPYVSINGSIICRTSVNSNGDLNRDTAMMVVRKGDVITSGGYSADTDIVLTYYPFKV